MTCEITFSAIFKKELKQLLKRHRSIQSDVASLVIELKTNPFMGTNLGNGFQQNTYDDKLKRKWKIWWSSCNNFAYKTYRREYNSSVVLHLR